MVSFPSSITKPVLIDPSTILNVESGKYGDVSSFNGVLIYSLLNKFLHEEFNLGFWNALLICALYILLIGLIIKAIEKLIVKKD